MRALSEGYTVHATFRDKGKIWQQHDAHWSHLDTTDNLSVDTFLSSTDFKLYARIIYLIGSLSGLNLGSLKGFQTNDCLVSQMINPLRIFSCVLESIQDQTMFLIMSSRSAKGESFDIPYSISKEAIEIFVHSATRQTRQKKKFSRLEVG